MNITQPLIVPILGAPVIPPVESLNTKLLKIKDVAGTGTGILFTRQQAISLVSLKLGEKPMLSDENTGFTLFVIRSVRKYGYESTFKYLSTQQKSGSHQEIVTNSLLLKEDTRKVEEEIMSFNEKVISAEGIYTCRKCGSKKTISAEKQVRSADEAATVTITCVDCRKQWKE